MEGPLDMLGITVEEHSLCHFDIDPAGSVAKIGGSQR